MLRADNPGNNCARILGAVSTGRAYTPVSDRIWNTRCAWFIWVCTHQQANSDGDDEICSPRIPRSALGLNTRVLKVILHIHRTWRATQLTWPLPKGRNPMSTLLRVTFHRCSANLQNQWIRENNTHCRIQGDASYHRHQNSWSVQIHMKQSVVCLIDSQMLVHEHIERDTNPHLLGGKLCQPSLALNSISS